MKDMQYYAVGHSLSLIFTGLAALAVGGAAGLLISDFAMDLMQKSPNFYTRAVGVTGIGLLATVKACRIHMARLNR